MASGDFARLSDFDTAIRALDAQRVAIVGPGLLTINLRAPEVAVSGVSALDVPVAEAPGPDSIVLERIWTSDPESYPVSGRKLKRLTPWTRQLLICGEIYVAEGDAALAKIFDDHARIASLGLHASINVPLVDAADRCFATFNVLGPAHRWSEEQVNAVKRLAALATPIVAGLVALRAE